MAESGAARARAAALRRKRAAAERERRRREAEARRRAAEARARAQEANERTRTPSAPSRPASAPTPRRVAERHGSQEQEPPKTRTRRRRRTQEPPKTTLTRAERRRALDEFYEDHPGSMGMRTADTPWQVENRPIRRRGNIAHRAGQYLGLDENVQAGPAGSYMGRTLIVTPEESREIGQRARVARERPSGQFAPTAGGLAETSIRPTASGPSALGARGQLGPTTAPISVRQAVRADTALDLARRGSLGPTSGPGGVEPGDAANIAEAVRNGELHTDIEYTQHGPRLRLLDNDGLEREWGRPGLDEGFFESNFPLLHSVASKAKDVGEWAVGRVGDELGIGGGDTSDALGSLVRGTTVAGQRIGGAPTPRAATPGAAVASQGLQNVGAQTASVAGEPLEIIGRGFTQIAEGFLYTPAAFYYLATDPKDTLRGMYEGVKYAFEHPGERPGDLAALIIGAKGLTSGRVANAVNFMRGKAPANAMGVPATSLWQAVNMPGPSRGALLVGVPKALRQPVTKSWNNFKRNILHNDYVRNDAGAMLAELARGLNVTLDDIEVQVGRHPVLKTARKAQETFESPPRGKAGWQGALSGTNQIFKMSLLFTKGPGYALAQHPGLAFMVANALGTRAPAAMARELGRLVITRDPVLKAGHAALGGTDGGFVKNLDLGDGPFTRLNQMSRAVGNFYQRFMDDIYRRAYGADVLRQLGYRTPDQQKEFLNRALDPNSREFWVAYEIRQSAKESFGNFSKMTDWERRWIADWVFFYPWIRASTRYAFRMPLDHPVKFAIVESAGNFASDRAREEMEQFFVANGLSEKEAEVLTRELRRMTPGIFMTSGDKDANAVSPQQLSVLQGPSDFLELGQTLKLGSDATLQAMLNFGSTPVMQLGGAVMNRDIFTGNPYPEDMDLYGRLGEELIGLNPWTQLARRMGWGFEQDQGTMFTYSPWQAILNPSVSTATPRGVNIEGLQDVVENRAREEAPVGAREAKDVYLIREQWRKEAKKHPELGLTGRNGELLPPIQEAFDKWRHRHAQTDALIASLPDRGRPEDGSGMSEGTERLVLYKELDLLVKFKVLTKSQAEFLKKQHAKSDQATIRAFRESGPIQAGWDASYGVILRKVHDTFERVGIVVPPYSDA